MRQKNENFFEKKLKFIVCFTYGVVNFIKPIKTILEWFFDGFNDLYHTSVVQTLILVQNLLVLCKIGDFCILMLKQNHIISEITKISINKWLINQGQGSQFDTPFRLIGLRKFSKHNKTKISFILTLIRLEETITLNIQNDFYKSLDLKFKQ